MSWDLGIAIGLHLLGVVWWIGGLAFITFVFLPLARAGKLGDISEVFQHIESRFAPQVKTAIIIIGIAGFYLLYRLNLWNSLHDPHKWWLSLMIFYWLWFVLMLFVLRPAGLLKRIMKGSGGNADKAWQRLHIIHGVLLILGLIIIAGAAGGVL
ncbi:hypothetical protein [Candidatus Nitrosacidococcus sp. I8]|uniref:hypothetical protein n=1 Tax=Candidatus Nitrosacidococcus sp. I8 TaxID=2942908 RepID=UPI002227BF84|nr:hypothetical protein [Candidatus Nitrosacidococcus sp. I8]CAH9018852.1 hypothetical protein NURINAE_01178 [Candidatus Nitrosacidococcus sp. I8]